MTLYEMTNAAKVLYGLLESEEIDEQAVADTIEGMGVGEKLESYAKIIKQFKADRDALKEEKIRIGKRQARCEASIERLENAVMNFLSAQGKTEDEVGIFKLKISQSKECIVDDITKIPSAYLTVQEPKVDRVAIKKALASGESIEGVHIQVNNNLSIK